MNLDKLKDAEKLELCKKYYFGKKVSNIKKRKSFLR